MSEWFLGSCSIRRLWGELGPERKSGHERGDIELCYGADLSGIEMQDLKSLQRCSSRQSDIRLSFLEDFCQVYFDAL